MKADIVLHPSSTEDLQRDSNERRKNIMSSKLKAYPFLESPPNPDEDPHYLELVGMGTKDNDKIDNKILYSIYKDAVDFLITEDRGIHKNSGKLGINERILLIDEAIQIFKSYLHKECVIAPPALKNKLVYNLNPDDPILTALKKNIILNLVIGLRKYHVKEERAGFTIGMMEASGRFSSISLKMSL
jgi:hypothetical protein